MPLYDYKCDTCGYVFEQFLFLRELNKSVICVRCVPDPRWRWGSKGDSTGYATRLISTVNKPIVINEYDEGMGQFITGRRHLSQLKKQLNLEER